ncbi:MAG TPA: FAD-dependent oxidoreductase [Firmicutes bacterium]|nr:FAD-dependent oxidoreductase [Bacillota bacterium]
MKNIVILGGGVGGLATAARLRRLLPRENRVTVIDRQEKQYYYPGLVWLIAGAKKPEALYRSLSILPGKGIEFIHDEAVNIDFKKKEVVCRENRVRYDLLVVATGADYDDRAYPGLAADGYNIWSMEGTTALRQALVSFSGGRIALVLPRLPVKCAGALYEVAFILQDLFRAKAKTPAKAVEITIYTVEKSPLESFGPRITAFLTGLLEKAQIPVVTGCAIRDADPSRKRLLTKDGEYPYDLLLYAPVHRTGAVVKKSGLGNKEGWIPADPYHLETAREGVFVLGDAAEIKLPGGGELSKCGAIATFQAQKLAANIAALLSGKKPQAEYKGTTMSFFETNNGVFYPFFGSFYAEPAPRFHILPAGRWWRAAKVLIEYMWLHKGKPYRKSQ